MIGIARFSKHQQASVNINLINNNNETKTARPSSRKARPQMVLRSQSYLKANNNNNNNNRRNVLKQGISRPATSKPIMLRSTTYLMGLNDNKNVNKNVNK
eukprot:Pgem_evm1s1175